MRFASSILRSVGFVAALIAALGLVACDEAEQRGKGKKKGASADGEEAGEGEAESADQSEAGEGGSEADGPTIEEVLAECGGNDAASAGPDDVIYEKDLKALTIVKKVLTVTATVDSTLDIKVTGSKTVQDSKVTVTKVEGFLSDLAKGMAEKQAAGSTGTTTFTNVPISEYSGLSDHKAYDGVLCTVVPATKVENGRGGFVVKAEFDPPVPSSVSPRAIDKRYEAELGKKKVFSGIKAKVTESTNPDLKTGSITGTVTIEKVAASAEVPDGATGKKTVKGDVAYKVTYSFGTPKQTFALGFAPTVTYYIDYKKHDLTTNVVDTTAVEGGIATFIHP